MAPDPRQAAVRNFRAAQSAASGRGAAVANFRAAQNAARSGRSANAKAQRPGESTSQWLARMARENRRDTPIGDALETVTGSVLDWVMRPSYAVADIIQGDFGSLAKNSLNFMVPGTQAIEPIAGSREVVSQALEERGVNFGGGIPGFLARLGVDVVTDPLTYVTLGTGSALRGSTAIARAAQEAAARSGARTGEEIAQAVRAGELTAQQGQAESLRSATRAGAELQRETEKWVKENGQSIVAGFRVPNTLRRGVAATTGTDVAKIPEVLPVIKSKALATGLEKVGVNLGKAKASKELARIFATAGGENKAVYQAFLGAMNTANGHKQVFGRQSDRLERQAIRAARAEGIKRQDASPTLSHLFDAPEVAAQAQRRVEALNKDLQRGRMTVEQHAAAVAAEPVTTRAAYDWLSANHNHGARFRFAEYDDAVRAFGNPEAPAEGSIMAQVLELSKQFEDYADAAGVLYTKLDRPYLAQLPADNKTRDALDELMEMEATRRGEVRRMQEGFTRPRTLETLRDWYEWTSPKTGERALKPELSVGRRLTVRGVAGASEATHATLMRELVRMFGKRGALPDMDELESALAEAIAKFDQRDAALNGMLTRATSSEANAKRSEAAKLRQLRIAASKAVAKAEKDAARAAREGDVPVQENAVLAAAKKRLAEIEDRLKELRETPRVEPKRPVDLDARRERAILEASRNLEIAQADRNRILALVQERVVAPAMQKIRDIKDRLAKADDPVLDAADEARVLTAEVARNAREEVLRLEGVIAPVIDDIIKVLRKVKSSAENVGAGAGSLRPELQKKKNALEREVAKGDKGDQEAIELLQGQIADIEAHIARYGDRGGMIDQDKMVADMLGKGYREQKQKDAARAKPKNKKSDDETKALGLQQDYDQAYRLLAEDPDEVKNMLPAVDADTIDDAHRAALELPVARDFADDAAAGAGVDDAAAAANRAYEDELDAAFGPDPAAQAAPDVPTPEDPQAPPAAIGEIVLPQRPSEVGRGGMAPFMLTAEEAAPVEEALRAYGNAERALMEATRRGDQAQVQWWKDNPGSIDHSGSYEAYRAIVNPARIARDEAYQNAENVIERVVEDLASYHEIPSSDLRAMIELRKMSEVFRYEPDVVDIAFPLTGKPEDIRGWIERVREIRNEEVASIVSLENETMQRLMGKGKAAKEPPITMSMTGAPAGIKKIDQEEARKYLAQVSARRERLRQIDNMLDEFWWLYPGLVKKIDSGPLAELDQVRLARMHGWLHNKAQSSGSRSAYGFDLNADPLMEARLTGGVLGDGAKQAAEGRRLNRTLIAADWEPADVAVFRGEKPADVSQYPSDSLIDSPEVATWRQQKAQGETPNGEHFYDESRGDEYRFQRPAPYVKTGEGAAPTQAAPQAAPSAQDVAQGQRVPTGESITVQTSPQDILAPTPIDDLPWSQRQVIKYMRDRYGKSGRDSWTSVKREGGQGYIRIGGSNKFAVSEADLDALVEAGWLVPDLNKNGQITRIKPATELLAEGRTMAGAIENIGRGVPDALAEVGSREEAAAARELAKAREPITRAEREVAELEAKLQTAIEQGRADRVLVEELTKLTERKKDARRKLKQAEREALDEQRVAPLRAVYENLKNAEKAAKRALDELTKAPPLRSVGPAYEKRKKAAARVQKAEEKLAERQAVVDAIDEYMDFMFGANQAERDAFLGLGAADTQADVDDAFALWDYEFGKRIGSRYVPRATKADPGGEVRFDPAVGEAIERAYDRIAPTVKSPSSLRKAGRFITGMTRAWKGLVLATPGYHLRNMIDDGLRAYWAGARNPQSFIQAVRILQGKQTTIKIRGKVYTADEISTMASTNGIIGTGSQYHAEAGPAYGEMQPIKYLGNVRMPRRPGQGAVVRTSQRIGEMREDFTRLGTFIELMKNGDEELIAAKRTRDFLFDYNDVSDFVRKSKDFWLPFITYTMKAVPFYGRTLVQRPGQIANLGLFMRDMTATAAYDYPGQVTMEYMAPGQELSFAIPNIPFVSDYLFGEGRTGAIDPSNLMGISAINQLSPITFPNPKEGESALGAALGTVPQGLGRVAGGFINPFARVGIELGTQRDMRWGSDLPSRVRMGPVPLAAQRLLSAATGGQVNVPGYGLKTDSYTGEQVEGMSGNVLRVLNLLPAISQVGAYATTTNPLTGALGFDNPFVSEADRGRIQFVRTLAGVPVRPLDISRDQYFASLKR